MKQPLYNYFQLHLLELMHLAVHSIEAEPSGTYNHHLAWTFAGRLSDI